MIKEDLRRNYLRIYELLGVETAALKKGEIRAFEVRRRILGQHKLRLYPLSYG